MTVRRSALLVLPLAAACSEPAPWTSQLSPAGACHRIDLADGLDEASTAELHDVFACLDGRGALRAYAPLDASLDATTRDGPVGNVLARWVNDLPDVTDTTDLSAQGVLDTVREVLDDPTGANDVAHAALELVYATPWADLRAGAPLNSATALEGGVLAPALPVAGAVATVLLEDDLVPLAVLADVARDPAVPRVAWTAASMVGSSDAALAPLGTGWADDLADAVERTRTPENDRWSGARGDSLRDLLEALLVDTDTRGRPVIVGVSEPLRALLSDAGVKRLAVEAVRRESDAARLRALPAGVLHLTRVDTDGGSLSPGEDSALVALLRLLRNGNEPFDCRVDLGFFDVDFSLGNLSVTLLERLADLDAAAVEGGVSLLGDALGLPLTDTLLNGIADTGVCPVLDRQMVRDLHGLDRLTDSEAGALLRTLLGLLDAARPRMDDLVEAVARAHDAGIVPPLEEAVRDLAESSLVDDTFRLVPALVDPWDHHARAAFPSGVAPVDLDLVWDVAHAALTPDETGRSPLDHLSGVLNAAFAQEGTWTAAGALGRVLGDPRATLPTLAGHLPDLLARDPSLESARTVADLLEDRGFMRPLLVIVEADAPRAALTTTELTQPGPIPFTAELVVDGTLDTLLTTLDRLATLLPEHAPDE